MDSTYNINKKYYSLAETPWYFGAYLNQARHNLYIVLNELTIKLGGNPMENDDELLGPRCKAITLLKEPIPDPILLENAMDYYEDKMPFLFFMAFQYLSNEEKESRQANKQKENKLKPVKNLTIDPRRYYDILNRLIKTLNQARNHFSHFNEQPFMFEKEIVFMLQICFDANIRKVKDVFKLEDKHVEHLRRYESKKDPVARRAVLKTNYKYHFTVNVDTLQASETGLAFFTTLFLSKGDGYLFLKKLSNFKRNDIPEFKATLQAFSINSISLPKERIESDNSEQSSFLDMCNELAKCPKELYEILAPEKQQQFITVNNEDTNEDEVQDMDATAVEPQQENKLVRNDNRFTYLAQRYIDIIGCFPTIRFAVDLGTYYYSIYNKVIADEIKVRRLTKHLIGFGKLEQFHRNNRPSAFINLYKDISPLGTTQTDPYIKEAYPHYHVKNNNIPLYAVSDNKEYWPVVTLKTTDGTKSYPNKIIKDREPKPYAYMSAMELPALVFYSLLQPDKNKVQAVITNHIKNIKLFFKKMQDGEVKPIRSQTIKKPEKEILQVRGNEEYNSRFDDLIALLNTYQLKPKHVPDKILDFLLGVEVNDWKQNAETRLKNMIQEARNLAENMEEKEKSEIKLGKKAFRKIKVGRLADILSEDMMLMQPILKDQNGVDVLSSKPNSTTFRLLQSRLAYFGVHKQKVKSIFVACNLLESKNSHPFLHNISIADKLGIIEFYKAYFREKIKFLKQCLAEKNYESYYFLKVKQTKSDLGTLVHAYLNDKEAANYTATLLPRGLYFEAILQWLKEHGSTTMKEYVAQFGNHSNIIHLVNFYISNEMKDEEQAFYQWERTYKLFNETKGKNQIFKYFSLLERNDYFLKAKELVIHYKNELEVLRSDTEKFKKGLMNHLNELNSIKAIKNHYIVHYSDKYPAIETIRWETIFNKNSAAKAIANSMDQAVTDGNQHIRAFRIYVDNEKYLRLASIQDKILFMCIQRMLRENVGDISIAASDGTTIDPAAFLLRNILPITKSGNKNILDCTPSNGVTMTIDFYECNAKGVVLKDKKQGVIEIKDDYIKIKNIGNFQKLVKDRRLNNLAFYFEHDNTQTITLQRTILENELKAYENERLNVLQKVAEFEKLFHLKMGTTANQLFYKDGIQYHGLYLDAFFKNNTNPNVSGFHEHLLAVRNGFAHNQYPFLGKNNIFQISSSVWQSINTNFKPSAAGSSKGYGVIEKISNFAKNGYQQLINSL